MRVERIRKVVKRNGYESVLLRHSYGERKKVKKRTIANLPGCSYEEIRTVELALKHKGNLASLFSIKEDMELRQGKSTGAVWVVYCVAKELEIEKALGNNFDGKLAFWQVIARVIEQGSRGAYEYSRDGRKDIVKRLKEAWKDIDITVEEGAERALISVRYRSEDKR